MKLYNTLSRQTEDFQPLSQGAVTLYTCGPTVYDYAHLGNLRSFVFDDILRRALELNGYKVKHVMNITDVGHLVSDMDEGEDKLEKGATREGKSVWEIAGYYIEAFQNDAAALNILPPNGYNGPHGAYARATDFINEQIEIIKLLLEHGFAYQTEQAIYFDVQKLPDYGELTGQKLNDKEVGARSEVVTDENKHHPQDFALWFFLVGRFSRHSMHWPSPWGEGFPGWHLECSAIIHATLGDPIDIHTGGVDHIGTHHTNEIAQTKGAYGHKLANYWLHNEFLLVNGGRMGKSLGNFYTLKDIVEKGYDPLALRLLFLQAHYRSRQNFTWAALDAAQAYLKQLRAMADLRFQPQPGASSIDDNYFAAKKREILDNLSDDLATPAVLAKLSEIYDHLNENGIHPTRTMPQLEEFLKFLDQALGLELLSSEDITKDQKQLLADREKARINSDWAEADKLRDELLKDKLEVSDTPFGQVWRRI